MDHPLTAQEQPSPVLAQLARAYGVATEYWGWKGGHVTVAAETIRSVLASFDVDASDDEAAARALRDRENVAWRRTVPQFTLLQENAGGALAVHVPHWSAVDAWLELEDGSSRVLTQLDTWVDPRTVDGRMVGEATFSLPQDLPLGWHTVCARIPGSDESPATGRVVVVPTMLPLPERVAARGARGLATQIYQVRSQRSWGMGDFADLADTCAWAGRALESDFVLVNPVHAAAPVPPIEPSPYLPTSRTWVDTGYIRVEDIPELAYAPREVRDHIDELAEEAHSINDEDRIDRDATVSLKREALHEVYRLPRSVGRQAQFEQFCEEGGPLLLDFATWGALIASGTITEDEWGDRYASPAAPGAQEFREANAEAVGFELWLQWIADVQLEHVQRSAVGADMSVGLMKDMAVGVHPAGADAWALADVLARGVTVGAPPDPYNQLGQDWSQPPWRPDRLEEHGYEPFRQMIASSLRHCGGLRIDHIAGLFRLWWVPAGGKPLEGTYVRLDHEAMVGILVLEATRAGAIIVGEDLGTVEPWVRDYLAGRGILGTSIFWFEQDENGFRAPSEYRRLCLASVTTHDLPPTAGYLLGEHVKVRDGLGVLTQPVEEEWRAFREERSAVLALLRERGLIPDGEDDDAWVEANIDTIVEGLHRFVSWTPSLLVSIAVADLAGDRRAINQPGTSDEYPNWRLPQSGPAGDMVTMEDLVGSRRATRLVRCVDRGQRPAK